MKHNQFLISLLTLIVILCSCKKDDNKSGFIQISGISLKNIDAQPIGTLGIPTDYSANGSADFMIYPNPCMNVLMAFVKADEGSNVHYYALPAEYKNAPAAYEDGGTSIPVKIENLDLDPNSRLIDANITATNGNTRIEINTKNYKRGFYRLYAEWNGGSQFIDFWVIHP